MNHDANRYQTPEVETSELLFMKSLLETTPGANEGTGEEDW